MKVYSHSHALFSKSSSSEIIALHNNWGMLSGSWYKWSWVQFGEICYAQLPSINSSGSDVPDLLLGILWNRLLFTALPLKDEIHEQGLTGQKITVYVSTYLLSAAKNLVSLAPGIWLHAPVSVLPGTICRGAQIWVVGWRHQAGLLSKVSPGWCWVAEEGLDTKSGFTQNSRGLGNSGDRVGSLAVVLEWAGDSKTKVKPQIIWAHHWSFFSIAHAWA